MPPFDKKKKEKGFLWSCDEDGCKEVMCSKCVRTLYGEARLAEVEDDDSAHVFYCPKHGPGH